MGVQSMWSSYFEAEILEEGDHEKRGLGNTGVALVRKNGQEKTSRWIGVDLDGTLAKSIVAQTGDEIGAPIDPMVQLVKKWLVQGEDVRIFTARVNPNQGPYDALRARRHIEARCQHQLGQILPVTYEKDWDMALLFDDRARQVEHDTGRVLGGDLRKDLKTHRNAIRQAKTDKSRIVGQAEVIAKNGEQIDGLIAQRCSNR
jgi:hypothetical protein